MDVIVTSSLDADSWQQLIPYLKHGSTSSFIGSSGVGKSTLVNRLAGQNILSTNEIRKDDKGRHTTTKRELVLLPQGGVVIDTPGMREIGVDSVDLSKSFADIDQLTQQCKFRDCSHNTEPGCAVITAIEKGEIETEKMNTMFADVGGIKNARKFIKEKNKRKY